MAARRVTGKVQLQLTADLVNALDNTGKVATTQVGNVAFASQTFSTTGVASNQMNRAWEDTDIAIASAANKDINLNDFTAEDIGVGAGNDGVGLPMDLQEIVLIAIKNTTAADPGAAGGPFLEVIPTPASGWTPIGSHTVANGGAIPPGGVLLKFSPGEAGFDVIPGVSESIRLTANGGNVTASVLIFGRNDDDESSSTSSASSTSSSASTQSSSSRSSSISSSLSSSSSS